MEQQQLLKNTNDQKALLGTRYGSEAYNLLLLVLCSFGTLTFQWVLVS